MEDNTQQPQSTTQPTEQPTEAPVAQPDGAPVEPAISTRSKDVYEQKDEKEVDLDNLKDTGVILPTATYKKLESFMELINKYTSQELAAKVGTTRSKSYMATGTNITSMDSTIQKGVYEEPLNNGGSWCNELSYGDKSLTMGKLPVGVSGTVTGNAAIAKFASMIGIGEYVQVPMYHSGFWITLRPPKDSDIINLEIALANNQIKLGRETNTLIYSNYSVIFTRILTDFIMEHVTATTVQLPEGTELRDFIMTQDLYPLIAGLLATMFPDGYPVIKNCINTLELEDSDKKCDYTVSANVDPLLLIRTNEKALTNDMRSHMSKKRPNSTTVDDIKEYQHNLKVLNEKVISVKANNGTEVKFTIKSPTLSEYIDNGEEWITNVSNRAKELFTEGNTEEIKDIKIKDALSAVILGIYNIHISKIEVGDVVVADRESINGVMDTLSGDDKLLTAVINGVKDYINESVVSIVATTTFTCPKCLEKLKVDVSQNDNKKGPFKEFIPLNALEHFFDLGALKVTKIKSRDIS